MANAYLNVYTNNPTADGTDGTQVSTDGANTSPISATLDASKAESAKIKCALRCESGYKTSTDGVALSFEGTTATKWLVAYSADNTGDTAPSESAFASTATIPVQIEQKNVIFWVKATSTTDENPANDTSVKLKVSAKIVAA